MKARGFGGAYRPTYKDKKTGKLKKSSIWWIQYYAHGKRKLENSHSRNRSDALKLLKKRLGEIVDGKLIASAIERTQFNNLTEMLINDYKINSRRSLTRAERSVSHLNEYFSMDRAIEITSDRITAYIAHRQSHGAANATINRELAALRRMFRLGKRAGKIGEVPYISLLQEDNVRKGFFDWDQVEAVVRHLPIDLKPVAEVSYILSGNQDHAWRHLKSGYFMFP